MINKKTHFDFGSANMIDNETFFIFICTNLPLASIGSPVNSIFSACLRFTARARATAGVEQNNPMRTLIQIQKIKFQKSFYT